MFWTTKQSDYQEYLNALCEKQNEIIDRLNSQAQPEERIYRKRLEDLEKKREKEKMIPIKDEDINVGKLKELASDNYGKDTPEEWEEELRDLVSKAQRKYSAFKRLEQMLSGSPEIYLKKRDYVEKEVVDDIVEKIKQLLDEREREVRKQERMIRLHKRVSKKIDNLEEPYKSFAKAGAGII